MGPLIQILLRASVVGAQQLIKQRQNIAAANDKYVNSHGDRMNSFQASDPRRAAETALYGDNPFNMAVGLMAMLVTADGTVSEDELRAVERIFAGYGAVGEVRTHAIAVFQAAENGTLFYTDVLVEAARQDLVFWLLCVAHANGRALSCQAEHLIRTTCTVLGLDYRQRLAAFNARHQAAGAAMQSGADQIKMAYEILGCSPADSDEQLRHRYRQLVRDFHPDTIAGKGLSPEFIRFAEEKFKQIQAAYEFIVEQRR